jgi:hypothetical protein
MTESRDPSFEALAGLRTIAPDANWEKRVRARCHSQIARHAARKMQPAGDTTRRLTLVDLAAMTFLFVYLLALLHEAAWLRGLL